MKRRDHGEIGIRVQVMDEMELLLAPEPGEVLQARIFYVVFPV